MSNGACDGLSVGPGNTVQCERFAQKQRTELNIFWYIANTEQMCCLNLHERRIVNNDTEIRGIAKILYSETVSERWNPSACTINKVERPRINYDSRIFMILNGHKPILFDVSINAIPPIPAIAAHAFHGEAFFDT